MNEKTSKDKYVECCNCFNKYIKDLTYACEKTGHKYCITKEKENDKILKQLHDQHNTNGVIRLLDNPYSEDTFFVDLEWSEKDRMLYADCIPYTIKSNLAVPQDRIIHLELHWNGGFDLWSTGKPIISQSDFKIFNDRVHTIVYEMGADMFKEKFELAQSVFKGEV